MVGHRARRLDAAVDLLILLMTSNRAIMGERVNSHLINVLGWITVVAIFSASIGLVIAWFIRASRDV